MRKPTRRQVYTISAVLLLVGLAAWLDLVFVEMEMTYQGDATAEEVQARIEGSPVHRTADVYTSTLIFPLGRAALLMLEWTDRLNAPLASLLIVVVLLASIVLNSGALRLLPRVGVERRAVPHEGRSNGGGGVTRRCRPT
jgi:hypothetical protein